jgi:ethanolamine utilization protein EutQ (cupin superfamily)
MLGGMTVELVRSGPLTQDPDSAMPGRSIIDPPGTAWTGIALMEWELTRAEWTDRHPHDEINYLLAGELHVESDGETVVAGPGDTVVVAAGSTARYSAPTYARMLAIYGPNPDGLESGEFAFRLLDGSADS